MRRLAILLCASWLTACSPSGPATMFLSFTETERGGEPYPVRMLVTDRYLRIEDGDGQSGFILFDRAARTIYSVSHPGRTILVIKPLAVTLPVPRRFVHAEQRDPAPLPAVDGHAVIHYRLQTNGETCLDVYAAEQLLPQAAQALREYHETLAGEQARTQARVPVAFQSMCDLADYVFVPARSLAHGFPVRQVNHAGATRQLTDFKIGVPVEPRLFELPEDYRQITTGDVRR